MKFLNSLKNEKSKNIYFDSVINPNAETAVIFLHGLIGSRRYWDEKYKTLSKKYSLYFVDLLGFGFSAKPHINYTLITHTEALEKFIDKNVKEKTLIFIGHSTGSIIALSYAKKHPDKVKKLYLLSLPYFLTENEAMQHLKKTTKLRYLVTDTLWTKATCTIVCYFGGAISRRFGYLLLRNLPKNIASDGFLHTYNSYISTLYNVIYKQNIPALLTETDTVKKIFLIHEEKDEVVPLENVEALSKKYHLNFFILPNRRHALPIEAKEKILKMIQ